MAETQADSDPALDYVQTEAWTGLLAFLLDQPAIRAQFEHETGTAAYRQPTGIEKLIDEASGYDPGATYIACFLIWATPTHWGDSSVITPSIQTILDRAHAQKGI